jgi:hypothetical protein
VQVVGFEAPFRREGSESRIWNTRRETRTTPKLSPTRYVLLRGSRRMRVCAAWRRSGAANKSPRCIASPSACGRGHFEADTRSDATNLWKIHRRRGQPMVFCGGLRIFGQRDKSKADRSRKSVRGGCKRETAQRGIQGVMSIRRVRGRKPCLGCRRTLALSPETINRSIGD